MTQIVRNGDNRIPRWSRPAVWLGAASLMVLPVVAIRGIDAAAWNPPGDFIFLALLLAGVGIAYELAVRVSDRNAYRVAAGIALVAGLFQIWINLAVGIIGSEDNPANLIYALVLAVAAGGAVVARLRPLGMARTMAATALAQALASAVVWVAGLGFTGPITIFFVGLWFASALLFRRAAGDKS